MAEIPKIVLPHGGYRKLIVYKKSDIIYEGSLLFCRRFLPRFGDRTVDQMIQAARSCKQNIVEGSAASGTSKETEIKLTNVARASLDELIEDYLDWLKSHNSEIWQSDDERLIAAREFSAKNSEWEKWKEILETRPPETVANLMLTICHQTRYMLDKMIARQEEDFKKFGGVRERMHNARMAARGEAWNKELYSKLSSAKTPSELGQLVINIRKEIDAVASSVARKKGWFNAK